MGNNRAALVQRKGESMIIDADTHISPADQNNTIRVEKLIEDMDRSGVDKALCWMQPLYTREVDESLKYIYESQKRFPERLLPFGWVDPHFGVKKGIETVHRCIEEYGFYGVKFNGAQNEYYIDDEEMVLPIIEEVARLGSRLAFHIGADAYEYTHPYNLEKIAKRYPDVPILVAHMGGAGLPNLARPCIEVAKRNPNITLIGSSIGWNSIVKAIREIGAERVCFGSDTPFSDMHADLAAYKSFLSDLFTKDEADLVLGGNIQKLFEI